jgi:hypothetical protein
MSTTVQFPTRANILNLLKNRLGEALFLASQNQLDYAAADIAVAIQTPAQYFTQLVSRLQNEADYRVKELRPIKPLYNELAAIRLDWEGRVNNKLENVEASEVVSTFLHSDMVALVNVVRNLESALRPLAKVGDAPTIEIQNWLKARSLAA